MEQKHRGGFWPPLLGQYKISFAEVTAIRLVYLMS